MAHAHGSTLSGSLNTPITISEHLKVRLVPQIALRIPDHSFLMGLAPGNVHCVPWIILGIAQAATALALSACVVGHRTARLTTRRAAPIIWSDLFRATLLPAVM